MAASVRAASGGLEPLDELADGEGLGERRAVATRRGRGSVGSAGSRVATGRSGWRRLLNWGRRRSRSGARSRARARARAGARARARAAGGGGRCAARSAVPDRGTGDGVRGRVVVNVKLDTGVGSLVGLGHVDTSGRESSLSAASDLDLTAAVVELSLANGGSLVETNHLRADPVATGLEIGELDVDDTLVVVEPVNTPLAILKTILPNLGPDGTLTLGVGLGDVDHDRAVVGGGNWVLSVARRRLGVVVVPLHANSGASGNLDLVGGSLATVADHGSRADIEDGVVAVGGSLNSKVVACILSANDEALEGGVGSGEVGSSQNNSGFGEHVGGCSWLFCRKKVESIFQR